MFSLNPKTRGVFIQGQVFHVALPHGLAVTFGLMLFCEVFLSGVGKKDGIRQRAQG